MPRAVAALGRNIWGGGHAGASVSLFLLGGGEMCDDDPYVKRGCRSSHVPFVSKCSRLATDLVIKRSDVLKSLAFGGQLGEGVKMWDLWSP